jgi:hypothetical protein
MDVVVVSGGTQWHFLHISVSWEVMPCSVSEVFWHCRGITASCITKVNTLVTVSGVFFFFWNSRTHDRSSRLLWNACILLPGDITLHPRLVPSSWSPLWEPQISLKFPAVELCNVIFLEFGAFERDIIDWEDANNAKQGVMVLWEKYTLSNKLKY